MKILISAYACAPNVGSEPGIGWQWAIGAAKLGHEVTVITREENKDSIEKELKLIKLDNISFLYFDLPKRYSWSSLVKLWPIKQGLHFYWHIWSYPYHYFWQRKIYRLAKKQTYIQSYDLIHHITLGTMTRSVFLGKLDLPFIFGPVGGGERAPFRLRKLFGWRARLNEFARDIAMLSSTLNPSVRNTFRNADKIYLKTPDSRNLVPKKYRKKAELKLEIGIHDIPNITKKVNYHRDPSKRFELLYVGRFLYWKGMDYGLRAFARFLEQCPNSRLTLVGKGPDEKNWKRLSRKLAIEENVNWISWVDQKKLKEFYINSDIFLFPSLHDSSGNVVLESISHGLPVLCLDLGGPATIVDESCATIVDTTGKQPKQVIDDIATSLFTLYDEPERLYKLKIGAINKSKKYLWHETISHTYKSIPPLSRV